MQAFKKILIPTDFSPVAWRAVQLGMSIARNNEVRLTLLHVYPSMAKFLGVSGVAQVKELADQEVVKKQMTDFFGDFALENGANLEFEVTVGTVDVEISRFIKSGEYDLVILGANSHGQDNTPGSNTTEVMGHSDVPILIVPNHLSNTSSFAS